MVHVTWDINHDIIIESRLLFIAETGFVMNGNPRFPHFYAPQVKPEPVGPHPATGPFIAVL